MDLMQYCSLNSWTQCGPVGHWDCCRDKPMLPSIIEWTWLGQQETIRVLVFSAKPGRRSFFLVTASGHCEAGSSWDLLMLAGTTSLSQWLGWAAVSLVMRPARLNSGIF